MDINCFVEHACVNFSLKSSVSIDAYLISATLFELLPPLSSLKIGDGDELKAI
jgi:hypothetical protein